MVGPPTIKKIEKKMLSKKMFKKCSNIFSEKKKLKKKSVSKSSKTYAQKIFLKSEKKMLQQNFLSIIFSLQTFFFSS